MNSDLEWERWGARDPYFGVITHPRFRSAALTQEAKDEFFTSGVVHVNYVLDMSRSHLDPQFRPRRVLDFGCGVGRVVIPFSALAEEVVGMDVSASMLAEARRNCLDRGAGNVQLVASDDAFSSVQGQFDLVHSCIVLQHIEVVRGRALFAALVDRVRPGGIGALHVTYAWDRYAQCYGQPPVPPAPPPVPASDALSQARARMKRLLEPAPPPATPALPEADPEMQMNYYNLNELLYVLQTAGVRHFTTDFTDHGGAMGVFLFFRKPLLATQPAVT